MTTTFLGRVFIALASRVERVRRRARLGAARLGGAQVDSTVRLERSVVLRFSAPPAARGSIVLSPRVWIATGAIIDSYGGDVRLAENCYVGPYSVIYGHGGVTIGRDTLIASHCRILSSEHAISPAGIPIRSVADQVAATAIGKDCWLGTGVTVTAGVTIGDECVVGAGAVVTRDLPARSIAVGVPARVIGSRDDARLS